MKLSITSALLFIPFCLQAQTKGLMLESFKTKTTISLDDFKKVKILQLTDTSCKVASYQILFIPDQEFHKNADIPFLTISGNSLKIPDIEKYLDLYRSHFKIIIEGISFVKKSERYTGPTSCSNCSAVLYITE